MNTNGSLLNPLLSIHRFEPFLLPGYLFVFEVDQVGLFLSKIMAGHLSSLREQLQCNHGASCLYCFPQLYSFFSGMVTFSQGTYFVQLYTNPECLNPESLIIYSYRYNKISFLTICSSKIWSTLCHPLNITVRIQ